MKKQWTATAPANIALIKYMGKSDAQGNQATNPSLSLTLANFLTTVHMELLPDGETDRWEPLDPKSEVRASPKFLAHLSRIKQSVHCTKAFLVRSANNFPADAGIASSASSFCALTKVTYAALDDLGVSQQPAALEQARMSRHGSGSSCRSFFGPFCLWDGNEVRSVPSKIKLVDFVAMVDVSKKSVTSSEAHARVKSSPLFLERAARSSARTLVAIDALATNDFQKLAEITWADFWDMHSLFHTSVPPFFYFAPGTLEILRAVESLWEKTGTGPIATIDAGANVHLLVRAEEAEDFERSLPNFTSFPIQKSGAWQP